MCGSIMWRKATAAALLALAVGYFYHGSPELPEQILQYINLPDLQSLTQSQGSVEQGIVEQGIVEQGSVEQGSVEKVISAAWETLITPPTRQWSKVAVG